MLQLDPAQRDLDAAKTAISKLGAWKDTLRPGQAKKLEVRLVNCLEAWAKEILPNPDPAAPDAADQELDDGEAAAATKLKLNAKDLFKVLQGVPAATLPNSQQQVAQLTKSLEGHASQEAKAEKVAKLDSVCLHLRSDSGTEAMQAFVEVGRVSSGIFFSEAVSTEDCQVKSSQSTCASLIHFAASCDMRPL